MIIISPVFPIEQRNQIRTQLLVTGISFIKEKGIKKMKIEDITKQVGIGKGTFYHFYKSKELFVYDVIQFSKNRLYETINNLVDEKGGINRDDFYSLLKQFSFSGSNNIINSITPEDERWLTSKLPPDLILNQPKEESIMTLLMKHMINIKKPINFLVVANMMKIMAISVENKYLLHQEVLSENLELMINQICDYIFENVN